MAQNSPITIENQGFPALRSDLNNSLTALATNNAGTSAPSSTYANQFWYDSTNDLLKMRNSDDDAWITLACFNQTTDEWEVRSAVIQAVDSAGVAIKTDDGTTRIQVQDDGDVVISSQTTISKAGTALKANRTGSDGTIIDLQKDGTAVGSIGVVSSDNMYVTSTVSGQSGVGFVSGAITPYDSGAETDNATDLGNSSNRFKDLFLSGGVYLGGTGSANRLDDYEEGTWTPTLGGTATYSSRLATYVKVGGLVKVTFDIVVSSIGTGSQYLIAGLPFTNTSTAAGSGAVAYYSGLGTNVYCVNIRVDPSSADINFTGQTNLDGTLTASLNLFTNGTRLIGTLVYLST